MEITSIVRRKKNIKCQQNINPKFHIIIFHKSIILLITYLIFTSSPSSNVWGANIYIDPTYKGTELGTFDKPYNSWRDFTITTGDDYFQKCGTSWTGHVVISKSATSANRILISAYYDDGGVVHESENPSFGEKCGNNANKPIITKSNQVDFAMSIKADYIELNSIQLKEGETTLYINGNNNYVQYCRMLGGIGGIRLGLRSKTNYNYIGYNFIYGYDADPGKADTDGIQLGGYSNYNTVEYNVIDGVAHSGLSTHPNASYNEVRYNSVYSYNDRMDQFLAVDGDHNKFHHNYCYDCGVIQMYSGDSNEIYYNIIDGISNNPYFAEGSGVIRIEANPNKTCVNNKIYNNLIYDRRDGYSNPSGIKLSCLTSSCGKVERNEIINNIFLNFDSNRPPFHVVDWYGKVESDGSDPDVNLWYNNVAYGYTDPNYAEIEGTPYRNANSFNTNYDAASGNRDDNPGLKDPSNSQFWPDSPGDNVVGNGRSDLDIEYNDLFDPNGTDMKTSPMKVKLKKQPNGDWYIGPYALPPVVSKMIPSPTDLNIIKVIE